MRSARVIYRKEKDGWLATSPEVPGYVAWGDTFKQVRERAVEGLPWFAEEPLTLLHMKHPKSGVAITVTESASVPFRPSAPVLAGPRVFEVRESDKTFSVRPKPKKAKV